MGRRHQVMTGIAVCWTDGHEALSRIVISEVEMRPATREELEEISAIVAEFGLAGESPD